MIWRRPAGKPSTTKLVPARKRNTKVQQALEAMSTGATDAKEQFTKMLTIMEVAAAHEAKTQAAEMEWRQSDLEWRRSVEAQRTEVLRSAEAQRTKVLGQLASAVAAMARPAVAGGGGGADADVRKELDSINSKIASLTSETSTLVRLLHAQQEQQAHRHSSHSSCCKRFRRCLGCRACCSSQQQSQHSMAVSRDPSIKCTVTGTVLWCRGRRW
jgi:hypothetical protein